MRPYLIVYILILSKIISAQPSETMKYLNPWQIKNIAKKTEKAGDIYSAIEYYEDINKKNPTKAEIKYKLGELHLAARNYPVAQQYFNEAFETDKEAFVEALFYRGLTKKKQGDYNNAKEDFNLFSKMIKGSKLQEQYKKKVKNEIDGCNLALKLKDNPLNVFILHLDTSINKAHAEASPFPITGNSMLYSSLKTDKLFYINLYNDTIFPSRQLYIARKKGEKWFSDGLFEGPFNEPNTNVLNPALNPSGNRCYIFKRKS